MAKRKSFKFITILSYIFVLLFVVGLGGLIFYFTNGFTTKFTSFYVVVNDEKIAQDTSNIAFVWKTPLVVDIKYTMDFSNEYLEGYTFEIKANPNVKDFDFIADDDIFSFQGNLDWANCFDIVRGGTRLVLTPKASKISDLLRYACHSDKIEFINDGFDYLDDDLLLLTLYSYDGKESITLGLHFDQNPEVILDYTEIVF